MIRVRHLTPEAVVDLAEGRGSAEGEAHVGSCAACREQVETCRFALQAAASVDVPEPSPLFWDHLSARVSAAIDREASPASARRSRVWATWMIRTAGAMAVVVLAAVLGRNMFVARPPAVMTSPTAVVTPGAVAASSDPLAEAADVDEGAWDLVSTLGATVEDDGVSSPVLAPSAGTVEGAMGELSAAERTELVKLLQAELARRSS
jgi:hypothetical protein